MGSGFLLVASPMTPQQVRGHLRWQGHPVLFHVVANILRPQQLFS